MRLTLTVLFFFAIIGSTIQVAGQSWQWTKGNKGAGMDCWPVATDPSGNVFVGGITWGPGSTQFGGISVPFSSVTTTVTPTPYQSIIVKYNAVGVAQWAQATKAGNSWIISIATDANGNSFMFGSYSSPTLQIGSITLTNSVYPNIQCFLAKFDQLGNVLWAKSFANSQPGGAGLSAITTVLGVGGVVTDASGNVYVTANFHLPSVSIGGITLNNTDPSGTSDDIFLAKFDPNGNVTWARNYGGNDFDDAYALTVTPAGDIYIAGDFSSRTFNFGPSVIANSSPSEVAFIGRLDGNGNPLWACASGGSGGEYAVGLASDASNNVYLTGGIEDNSISYSGATITNSFAPQIALYLVKFDPSNNVSWWKTVGSPIGGSAWGFSIALSVCGNVWVSGAMSVVLDTPLTTTSEVIADGNIIAAPAGSPDPVFIVGYSYSGTFESGVALSSGADDQNGIACDASGCLYICSDYQSQLPFYCSADSLPVDSAAGEMLYVSKYSTLKTPNPIYKDTTFCSNPSLVLTAPDGYSYLIWYDGNTGAQHPENEPGSYWVYGIGNCASSILDTFNLVNCDCSSLFVPNSFTPNHDNQDDVFYPRGSQGIRLITSFRIYNRWGNLVFERSNFMINDISNAWDGTYNNQLPLTEVFVWVVDAICENGATVSKKGSVTVVR